MNPFEVIPFIEGKLHIGIVPVEPGLTNIAYEKDGERVVGFNSESSEMNEGLIRFDIIFNVRIKSKLSKIIINVEAQKDDPSGYKILNRAIYYVARMISSQKEREFSNSNYDEIKPVYSIWICMDLEENSMSHIHLTRDHLIGSNEWKGNLQLMNIVMLGVAKELPEHDEKYELHRLLGALLLQKLGANEKLDIIGNEYGIPLEEDLKEEVNTMCNLSQKIEDNGRAEEKIATVLRMYKNKFTMEQIEAATGKSREDILAILKEKADL